MPDQDSPAPSQPSFALRLAGDFLAVLRFYTRIPVPVFRFEAPLDAPPDFHRAAFALPLVGAVVGLAGAGAGGAAYLLGISTTLAAILCVAAMVIVTGAFHEDGLADSCDGLFGGATPERRLEIMRDSRLGTFGVAGLSLALLIRIFALAELFRLVGPAALALVVGIAAVSRPLALLPTLWLPPAATSGLGRSVPMPGTTRALLAMGLGAALALGSGWPADLIPGIVAGLLAAVIVIYALTRLVAAKINGYTGDVLGLSQQGAEMALLLALSAAANWHGPV